MTPIEACQETKELWEEMAFAIREKKKLIWKRNIHGPWENYTHNCPCCECAKHDDSWNSRSLDGYCSCCPMKEEWLFYTDEDYILHPCACEEERSPYRKYIEVESSCLCMDAEFFCLLIAEMAEEAIIRLKEDRKCA